MFTAIAAGWSAFTGWASRNPIVLWIIGGALFIIGAKKVIHDIKQEARKAERAAIAKKQAEVKAAVVERKSEIIAEEIEHADNALDARNSDVHYPTFDELPDAHKRLANGGKGGGSGS